MKHDFVPWILVAEDDPDDALMLKDAFAQINQHSIEFLSNGKLLVDYMEVLLADNRLPTLVLVDLNMPVLDGRGVIKELRKNLQTKSIPVIVLSTSKNKEDIDSTMALGANDFFTKPSSFNELVNITNSITSKWLTP